MKRVIIPLLTGCLLLGGVSGFATGAEQVTVTDDRGTAIVISSPPDRIIAVGALYAQVLVDLGAVDRLVAIADSPNNPSEVADLVSVGPSYAPNVEVIISLSPDLVLGATDWGGERPALEAAGFIVLTTPMLTSIPEILASVRTIGTAVGLAADAIALTGRISEAVAEVENRVLGLPRTRAAFLYPPSLGVAPYAAGADAIEGDLLTRAGASNVFADVSGFPQVNLEDVLARDPEVIFTDPSQIAFITDDPLLQGVSAVKSGRVFGINAGRATSTAVADVLAKMARLLHPE